ncbi:hypothetical protein AMS68_003840 [Peltaster fructicola]|uniref:F-box domain-containing protein n=1 Tax=Peltaster fructicola TaxID=286661 RepID=A0A6H0XUB9_9PEZI|nr:hypothetical protein AMS68_003840 [Peltaster fructicola]
MHSPTSFAGALNEDVLYDILQRLGRKDLASACLIDKSCQAIAEPLLYTRFDCRWEWCSVWPTPIITFLNAILRRPALAKHVRVLNFTGKRASSQPLDCQPPLIPIKALDIEAASRAVMTTGVSFMDEWRQQLSDRSMDALVALVVSQTPMITHLILERAWSLRPRLLCMVVAASLDGNYNLPTLPDDNHIAVLMDDRRRGPRIKAADPYSGSDASTGPTAAQGLTNVLHDYSSVNCGWPSTDGAVAYRMTSQLSQGKPVLVTELSAAANKATIGGFDTTNGIQQWSFP